MLFRSRPGEEPLAPGAKGDPKKAAAADEKDKKDAKKDDAKPDNKKDHAADLERKKRELEWEIARLGSDEERLTHDKEQLEAKATRTTKEIEALKAEAQKRQHKLEAEAKAAKKRGKAPKSPAKDLRLRDLKRKIEAMPREADRIKTQLERVNKDLEETSKKKQEQEEALRAIEAEIQKAKAGAGGGGGGAGALPPPTDEVKTSQAVLAAITPKGKKIETDAETATKDFEKLDKEVKELDAKVKKGETDLKTATEELNAANAEVKRLEGQVSARTAQLKAQPAPADGKPAPKPEDDANLRGLKSQLTKAKADQAEKKKKHTQLTQDLPKWKAELKKKTDELQKAEKKKHDATKAKEDYDKAIESLKDPQGSPMWQKIAGEYGVSVKAIPLPPGMVRDESGNLVKEEDLKKKEEGPPKTEEEKKKEADEARKKKEEEAAEEAKLTPEEKKKKKEEKEKLEKEQLLASISAAKDKPKAEREAELKRIAEEQHKSIAEIERIYKAKVDGVKKYTPGMKKEEALKQGISAADFDLMDANNRRRELQEKAAKVLGLKDGQEAVDQLWKNARERGLKNPGEMLTHLSAVDVNSLPKDLQEAAKRAKAAERDRINALPLGSAERKKAEDAAQAAAKDAAKAEKRFGRNKELAVKLDCTPEEADQYVKSLASMSGTTDEDEAAEALLVSGKKKATPPADLAQKIKDIHLLPPGPGRKAALLALAQETGDPKLLLGATLAPEQGDGVVIKGQVANKQLKSQLEAIDKLPPDQQWDAICNLSRITGTKPNDLERARRNLEKRSGLVKNVSAIESDETLTEKQKKEKIEEIAKTQKVTVEQLREFARVERNKAATTVTDAVKKDPTLQKELDALNLDTKKTPAEREQALKEIARRTGLDMEDLQNWNKMYEFRQKRARWKAQFKSGSDTEAADKMADLVNQYGSSDAAKEHLRNCPRDKLPPELRALKDDLEAWDKANPGAEVAPKLKRADPDDPDYKKRKKALLKELNATWTKDSKALKLLQDLSPEERALMMKEEKDVFDKFFKGVDGDTKEGKAAANLFGEGQAYQAKLDKEDQDKTDREAKAAEFEAQVQTARDAAKALDMPIQDARAHLQAVATGNGMTPQQALVWLKSQPGKSPSEALKAAYAAEPDKDSKEKVNPILRARLEAIDLLPPRERAEAFAALKKTSGISDRQMDKALTATRRDANISADLHALRDLPKAERDAALKDLLAKYKLKDPSELEAIYQKSLEQIGRAHV